MERHLKYIASDRCVFGWDELKMVDNKKQPEAYFKKLLAAIFPKSSIIDGWQVPTHRTHKVPKTSPGQVIIWYFLHYICYFSGRLWLMSLALFTTSLLKSMTD